MAAFEIDRTELVWPGKYNEQGEGVTPPRVALPLQTIETINETLATHEARQRPAQGTLFDVWSGNEGETIEEGWRNKLIWGDNHLVMSSLLERFSNKIDLIYIDPPFATGADFSVTALIGDTDDQEVTKAQSAVEEKAYRDTWGRGIDSYLSMLRPRVELMRDLLSDVGTLWVHLDWHVGHYVKLVLDEVFGQGSFLNEVVRVYAGGGQSKNFFPRKHEPMFVYTKGDHWIFNEDDVRVPYDSDYKSTVFSGKDTRAPGKTYRPHEMGKIPEDWWQFNRPYGDEIVGYPTQKPEALLERIIRVSSDPESIVADFFAGSGTTAVVAERLRRRWIACDLGRFAVHTTRKRLMGIEGCRPYEILNLGKYERQYWQSAAFGGRDAERVLFEYLVFMLRLYGAEPLPGFQHLHGKRGGAVVHVGAVDAPVTISEVTDSLDECVATGQSELHVLGWEWEMGLNDLVDQLAQEHRVRLKLLAIPREVMERQAVEKGDIRFFELAHLDCRRDVGSERSLTVELTDFAMSDADAIDPDVRAKISKWSDYVDYWAIDFDFRNDTFMNGWVTYRTRKDRRLALRSETHRYPQAGTYHVAVKVVDIFGNDTTRVFPVEVA